MDHPTLRRSIRQANHFLLDHQPERSELFGLFSLVDANPLKMAKKRVGDLRTIARRMPISSLGEHFSCHVPHLANTAGKGEWLHLAWLLLALHVTPYPRYYR